ncbi:hypothetical protein JMJ35_007523 [Cladonia borealis]|uniref:Uncharacterized protein n=1 Tax=Cladonia borealis TaxID=184061 RepID=A0AA39QXJ6_9LECA|nr:hypothetical protein JMJ35_007523 [Cladonia borealis]
MDLGRILNSSPNGSHPSEASAGNSASNLRQLAEIASASTPSTNIHETAAMTDGTAPEQNATANDALPYPGFDPDYDDERRSAPEVEAGPDNGLPTPPPPGKSSVRKEPPKAKPTPRTISSANSQRNDTSPAAPTPVINVHRTTAASSSGAQRPISPRLQRGSSLASFSGTNIYGRASGSVRDGPRNIPPPPGPTHPRTSRQPDLAARSSNGVPDDVEIIKEIINVDASVARPKTVARDSNQTLDDVEIIKEVIDVDASVARPNTVARSSNRIPDIAEIIDVDASVTRPDAAARSSNLIPDVAEIIDVDAPVRRPNTVARDSNRIPDIAEIIDVDASVTRPDAAARSSNRIPDVAEIVDADAWEARRRTQSAPPPSDLSVQIGSSAPVSPVQASSRTQSLSELEQNAVDFLASNSRRRDIPQGHLGSRTGSYATVQDNNPFPGQETEPCYCLNIDIALHNDYDADFGVWLLFAAVDKCHKADDIRKGKQRKDEAPLSSLIASIENDSSTECESCDEECEVCDEDAANLEYIYTEMAPRNGNELQTIRAHLGDAVWALIGNRPGPVSDSHKWKRACGRCNPCSEEQREEDREQTIPLEEDREQTIPLEEAAVDDKKNGIVGAAAYNPDLYTTTSSMRETRIKPAPPKAKSKDKAMASNLSSSSPSDQAPSSHSKGKGKEKANGDGNSNQSHPTLHLASVRATSSRPIGRSTREANISVNGNARGIQARPPSPIRTSLRNRQLFGPQPLPPLPPLAPLPVIASSSHRSQLYVPSPLGQTIDLSSNATTPEPVQTSSNNKRKGGGNENDEQGSRGGKKEKKKNESSDCKENGKANDKRKASEAVDEDADAACIRVTRPRRNVVSNPSTVFHMSGALQNNQTSASSSGTLAANTSRTLASSSGTRLSNLRIPGRDVVAANVPDAVVARSNVAPPRDEGERERERRIRLILRVAEEADPEHPGHEMYLTGRAMGRQRGKESRRRE